MAKLEPIHPGEILSEEFMKPLDLSANALALALRAAQASIGNFTRAPSRRTDSLAPTSII